MKTINRVANVTKKNLLQFVFFDLSIKDNKKYKSMYENKKENILKTKNNPIVKKLRIDNKKQVLWQVTLYKNQNDLLTNELLNEYNWVNKKDNLIKINTIKQLYNLYNTLYNVLYNWQVKQDLFGFYKSYYKSKINNNWLVTDTKDIITFEQSIHYFIMNILDNKVVTKKSIKKDYIVNLYIRFIQNEYSNNFDNYIIDWELIDNWLSSYINSKYIYDSINTNWQLDKLQLLYSDKDKLQNEYKDNLIKIKEWLIDKKDKEKLHDEYVKKVTNINNKIKRIKDNVTSNYLFQ